MADETLSHLLSVLADPATTKARAKELQDAAANLDKAKEEHAKRLKEIEKAQADANAVYKKASEAQVSAARDLKAAEDKRREAQVLLDQTVLREAEAAARTEAARKTEADAGMKLNSLAEKERALQEREVNLLRDEEEYATAKKELDRKLSVLKSIAA
jgi:hypothetical protein